MRCNFVFLMIAFSMAGARACCPPPVYYDVVYWQPLYWAVPCPGPTALPVVPPPRMEANPPQQMPKKERAESPYAPITPAAAEEKIVPRESLPMVPEPMKEAPKVELPKLEPPAPKEAPTIVLPSAVPSVPKIDLPLPPLERKKSTSNYASATNVAKWSVDGDAPANGQYRVGFFNFSDREVIVTVNGASMTLPKRTTITANVAKSFKLSVGNGESETVNIESAGLDVILK